MLEAKANDQVAIRFRLNGREVSGTAEPRMQLADFIRQVLRQTGTHVGCEHGVCGACTIMLDGRAVRSCTLYAVQAEGGDVATVEGISDADGMNDLQQAFRHHHALQCGFCTAGILISATQFLAETKNPTEHQVRDMLSGHLCRCTGYAGIVEAILETARTRAKSSDSHTKE